MVHGTWYMVHGTWYMVHGTWNIVHGTCVCENVCARPRVRARAAAAAADTWELHVNISFPLIGTVVEYAGTMVIED